jgi:NAD+ diphosphatase
VVAQNTFAGARLDRVTARRRDPAWVAAQRADPAARAVLASDGQVLALDGELALVPLSELGETGSEPLLLGVEAGRALFAVDADGLALDALAPAQLVGVRDIAAQLGQSDGGLLAYASALLNWHRRHGFCNVCGKPSDVAEAGLLRVCPQCGSQHHPRTDPVVIMLVLDGHRVLLGRQPSWPAGRYSALAGFVEPGESLEDGVAREVLEETGVEITAQSYVSSQPWPFPSSLMLGFTARYAGGEPSARDGELEDARWFSRAELEAAAAGDGPLRLPPRLAIARRLIDGWLAEDS